MNPLVLVVDDEPDIVECVRDLITGTLGYGTVAAGTEAEAMRLLSTLAPGAVDLLLVDHDMAVPVDAVALLERVQARHPGLPLVLCTSHVDVAIPFEGDPRVRVVAKPFDPDDLVHAVRDLVAHRREELAAGGDADPRPVALPAQEPPGQESRLVARSARLPEASDVLG